MFKEILKIIPKLDTRDVDQMERTLNARFQRVAKKFGGGILNVIKGGGIAGLAISLIDKLVNPLQAVVESIDKSLSRGDDLETYAKQFQTTSGNLARLQAFGRATGLDPEGLRLLIGKFQASVAQAAADPSKPSAVSAFVGREDMAESFFEFVQAMQKLTATQQNLVQQEVFGEKQILKAAEFLSADFQLLSRQIGGPSSEALTQAAGRLGAASDLRDIMAAQRELGDLETKSRLIGPRTIKELARGEDVELARENKRLGQFDDLKKISMAADRIAKTLEDGYLKLAPALAVGLPALIDILTNAAKTVEKSRVVRGLLPGSGKDK